MTLTSTGMLGIREKALLAIDGAQYQAGGTWYDADLAGKYADSSSANISFYLPGDENGYTVTAVRLLDGDGNVAGNDSVNITVGEEDMLYIAQLNIAQVV